LPILVFLNLFSHSAYSGFIHIVSCLSICFFLLRIIYCNMDIPHLDYPFISWCTFVMFSLFGCMNTAAVNIYVQVFMCTHVFISPGYSLRIPLWQQSFLICSFTLHRVNHWTVSCGLKILNRKFQKWTNHKF
jgi:hypothetical protein